MNDRRKTKAQLIEELEDLRRQLAASSHERAPELDRDQLEHFATQGTWLVDTDFVVRVANDAMCRLFGEPAEQIVGRKCYDVMSGPLCHTEGCVLRRAFAGGSPQVEEARCVGKVPVACRVVAHVVQDRDAEPVGIVERVEEAQLSCKPAPSRQTGRAAGPAAGNVPGVAETSRLVEAALAVARELRADACDASLRRAERLEQVCSPWSATTASSKGARRDEKSKPRFKEVATERTVLVFAPQDSRIRGSWAELFRRAGYALSTPDPRDRWLGHDGSENPTCAILDLAMGDAPVEAFHESLRNAFPSMPIIVLSSSGNGALEARRWRRACTWYVPRTSGGDEIVRLVGDVSPRPVLRSRPER